MKKATAHAKTETDRFWNDRANEIEDTIDVNITDVFQRELELSHISKYLKKNMIVLEAGCGNGFSTNFFRKRVKQVDAFDFSPDMIARAKETFSETNNQFFVDDILNLKNTRTYDAAICVRVLINLADLKQQKRALTNLSSRIKNGGLLILVEGFSDGFAELSAIREAMGLSPIHPSPVNFYSSVLDVLFLLDDFHIEGTFDLGAYDYLTRVVYPLFVGEKNVEHNSPFAEMSMKLSKLSSLATESSHKKFSRVRGFVLRKVAQ